LNNILTIEEEDTGESENDFASDDEYIWHFGYLNMNLHYVQQVFYQYNNILSTCFYENNNILLHQHWPSRVANWDPKWIDILFLPWGENQGHKVLIKKVAFFFGIDSSCKGKGIDADFSD